jgi:hypothetical protein
MTTGRTEIPSKMRVVRTVQEGGQMLFQLVDLLVDLITLPTRPDTAEGGERDVRTLPLPGRICGTVRIGQQFQVGEFE